MFRAIGLILLLIAVRFLMPMVFHGLEATLVQFFQVSGAVLTKSQDLLQASPGAVGIHTLSPL